MTLPVSSDFALGDMDPSSDGLDAGDCELQFKLLDPASLPDTNVHAYYCCVNSCCTYVGERKDMTSCPYCEEPAPSSSNEPHRVFYHTPLALQLRSLLQSVVTFKNLGYRTATNSKPSYDILEPHHSLHTPQVSLGRRSYNLFDNALTDYFKPGNCRHRNYRAA